MPVLRFHVLPVIALFLAGAGLAVWAAGELRRSGQVPQFYQDEFAPAVMLTCGQGYHNIDWRDREPLASFLLQRVDTFSCQSLPQSAIVPLDFFQRMSRYLEYTVAAVWKVFGLSWRTMGVLHGTLGGLVAVALYGIMRLGLDWPLACVMTLTTLTSPLNLRYVPELRDYSKTPFLLALVLIMGLLVKHLTPPSRVFFLAATAGIVAGVGFGFRTDLIVLVLPFALAVLCFRRSTESSRRLHAAVGISGVAVFVGAFVATAWPVISGSYSKGGTTAHVALLGFGSFFDAPLGVEARHYELSPLYSDAYEEATVRDYARRTSVAQSAFLIGSEEYAWQSTRYLGLVITTFPADVVIRAIASTGKIIDIGFTDPYGGVPGWMRNPLAARGYAFRQKVVASVPWLGVIATMAAALGLLCRDRRVGVFYIFLTIFMTASAALQFHERHFFYLEFIGWWSVAVVSSGVIRLCWTAVAEGTLPEWLTVPRLSKAVIALGCVAAAGGSLLWAARAYQQQTLSRLFAQYLDAPSAVVPTETTAGVEDKLFLRLTASKSDLGPPEAPGGAYAEYLKLELVPSLCDALLFDATIRYAATSPKVDFTHHIRVPVSSTVAGSTVIVLPVFRAYSTRIQNLPVSSRFDGIEIDRNEAPCVRWIRRVPDVAASNALMTAILSSDWHAAQHYQTLEGIERRYDGAAWMTDVYSAVPDRSVNRSILEKPVESIVAATAYHSRHVRFVGSLGVEMNGAAETPYAYLVQTGDRPLQAGRYAIAEGQLYAGGLTFGLLRNHVWYQQMRILSPGRFVAVARTTEEGLFSIVLANQNDSPITPTSFRVDRIGWIGDSSGGSSSGAQ